MESFSRDRNRSSSATPPPPYSSVVPHSEASSGGGAEGRSHKRQPCFYFLSGYCRNGTECPDYHGVDPEHMDDLEVKVALFSLLILKFVSLGSMKISVWFQFLHKFESIPGPLLGVGISILGTRSSFHLKSS